MISNAAYRWEQVAKLLHIDSSVIRSIGWNSRSRPEDACTSVLAIWLGGGLRGGGVREPITWATLVEVLEEAHLGYLSNELKSVLD